MYGKRGATQTSVNYQHFTLNVTTGQEAHPRDLHLKICPFVDVVLVNIQ